MISTVKSINNAVEYLISKNKNLSLIYRTYYDEDIRYREEQRKIRDMERIKEWGKINRLLRIR